jgi:hypothetical protein
MNIPGLDSTSSVEMTRTRLSAPLFLSSLAWQLAFQVIFNPILGVHTSSFLLYCLLFSLSVGFPLWIDSAKMFSAAAEATYDSPGLWLSEIGRPFSRKTNSLGLRG